MLILSIILLIISVIRAILARLSADPANIHKLNAVGGLINIVAFVLIVAAVALHQFTYAILILNLISIFLFLV